MIGAGYVGLVQAVGLVQLGHDVALADRDAARVQSIAEGRSPIYEVGLDPLLAKAIDDGSLRVLTSNREAVDGAQVVFLALPTPTDAAGSADTSVVFSVVDELASHLMPGTMVVTKSTVPVGTNAAIARRLPETCAAASNPEFLREGSAISDFMNPDRIVIGMEDRSRADVLVDIYRGIDAPVMITNWESAELIKYASNGYLASRVAFANAIANVSEAVGADVRDVLLGMGYDHRIGFSFMRPGPGYGGSCFPKDTQALATLSSDAGYRFSLIEGVIAANADQQDRVIEKVRVAVGGDLNSRRVALWGLAFKAGTDDTRDSPAVRLAIALKDAGADVIAFDPQASVEGIAMAADALEAVDGADVLLIATEWPQFQREDLAAVAQRMAAPNVVDARNLLDPTAARAAGFTYAGIGR